MRLDASLVEEMRRHVRDFRGAPLYESPSGFLEAAITAHLITQKRRLDEINKGINSRDHNTQHSR